MYPHVNQFETPELRRERALLLATPIQPRPALRRRFRLSIRRPAPAGC